MCAQRSPHFCLDCLETYPSKLSKSRKHDCDAWTNRGNLNFNFAIRNPIQVNNNEFVVATAFCDIDFYQQGIWAYNINKKSWKYVLKYDKTIVGKRLQTPEIAYNPNKCELYLYSVEPCVFFGINLLNQQHTIYENKQKFTMWDPPMVFAENCLHFIGQSKNCSNVQHLSFDFVKKDWSIIHTFKDRNQDWDGFNLIYLKQRNKLMLLGGRDGMDSYPLDSIYTFDFNTCKWIQHNRLTLPRRLYSFSCMVSADEKYLTDEWNG